MKNPGWVDLQVNGCIGIDFSDPELTEEQFLRAADWLLSQGTDIFLPTIVTSTKEVYQKNPELIRKAVERHHLSRHIPGLHLEGPFLSACPGAIGAHDPQSVLPPSPESLHMLCNACDGFLRLLTLAAEIPGSEETIREAGKLGITVSAGHHMAGLKEIGRAADAGALALTHLGNGIPNEIDRHRNPVWAGLAEDRLTAMIITDGHHLPPEVIKAFLRCKGAGKIIVTSDASPVAGLPPGTYNHILGNHVILEKNGRLHNPEKGCLVGSSATISVCMDFLEKLDLLTEDELSLVGRINAMELIGIES